MIRFGIDPGKTGGIAVENTVTLEKVTHPMPVEDGIFQEEKIHEILSDYWTHAPDWFAVVETQVIYRSKNTNLQTAAGLMHCYGAVVTVLKILKIPFISVVPTIWKDKVLAGYGGSKAEKKHSIQVARQLNPDIKIKNDGEADSWLLLHYGKELYKHGYISGHQETPGGDFPGAGESTPSGTSKKRTRRKSATNPDALEQPAGDICDTRGGDSIFDLHTTPTPSPPNDDRINKRKIKPSVFERMVEPTIKKRTPFELHVLSVNHAKCSWDLCRLYDCTLFPTDAQSRSDCRLGKAHATQVELRGESPEGTEQPV